jgi:hypothetical protein
VLAKDLVSKAQILVVDVLKRLNGHFVGPSVERFGFGAIDIVDLVPEEETVHEIVTIDICLGFFPPFDYPTRTERLERLVGVLSFWFVTTADRHRR